VVHVSVTGYGLQGPDADRPAFDFAAFWARSGIMSVIGHPGAPPVLSRVAQGDHTTGINGLAATLAALRLRDQTGKGQVVEVSLQRTGVYTIATDIARVLVDGTQPAKLDRTAPPNPLFNSYETGDGQWVMIVHMTPDPYWAPFCRAIGKDEWVADPRYATMRLRIPHGPALAAEIQACLLTRPLAYWAEMLDRHGLIWAPVAQLPDVVQDPQLREMGAFGTIDHPAGAFETVATPFLIREADIAVRGPSHSAGEDTADVLAGLGLDNERIASLAAAGVLG
jgi:crotonobetainyl-CoA:carnitine CoA-transferase CaiB-like acyl-CoA transferase